MVIKSPEKHKTVDPRQQVLDYLIGGFVTLFTGVGLMMAARLGMIVLAIPGLICIAVGVPLLIAAFFTYPIARRLGLCPVRSVTRS